MTHEDLVTAAAAWLTKTYRCPIVVTELVNGSGEIPDAIGFWLGGRSVLVECKMSRADFLADRKKGVERMGDHRFYLTPPGLLGPVGVNDWPVGWGLLELHAKGVEVVFRSHALDCQCERREWQGGRPKTRPVDQCYPAFERRQRSAPPRSRGSHVPRPAPRWPWCPRKGEGVHPSVRTRRARKQDRGERSMTRGRTLLLPIDGVLRRHPLPPQGKSLCTRCKEPIPPELLGEYLGNDHLCNGCAGVGDAEHERELIELESR